VVYGEAFTGFRAGVPDVLCFTEINDVSPHRRVVSDAFEAFGNIPQALSLNPRSRSGRVGLDEFQSGLKFAADVWCFSTRRQNFIALAVHIQTQVRRLKLLREPDWKRSAKLRSSLPIGKKNCCWVQCFLMLTYALIATTVFVKQPCHVCLRLMKLTGRMIIRRKHIHCDCEL